MKQKKKRKNEQHKKCITLEKNSKPCWKLLFALEEKKNMNRKIMGIAHEQTKYYKTQKIKRNERIWRARIYQSKYTYGIYVALKMICWNR